MCAVAADGGLCGSCYSESVMLVVYLSSAYYLLLDLTLFMSKPGSIFFPNGLFT